jgi:hypothetical protein
MIVVNLVTPETAAKLEHLLNKISVTRKLNKILPNFWKKVARKPKYVLHQSLI